MKTIAKGRGDISDIFEFLHQQGQAGKPAYPFTPNGVYFYLFYFIRLLAAPRCGKCGHGEELGASKNFHLCTGENLHGQSTVGEKETRINERWQVVILVIWHLIYVWHEV